MVKLDNWEKVLQLKDRIMVINHEIAKINRFLENPFENKELTVDKRKTLWIKATKKKQMLEKELAESKKILMNIIDMNKKYERGGDEMTNPKGWKHVTKLKPGRKPPVGSGQGPLPDIYTWAEKPVTTKPKPKRK